MEGDYEAEKDQGTIWTLQQVFLAQEKGVGPIEHYQAQRWKRTLTREQPVGGSRRHPESQALRTPPTQPDSQTRPLKARRWPTPLTGGGRPPPTSMPTGRDTPSERPSHSWATAAIRSRRPPRSRISPPAAFPGLSSTRRPSPAGLSPDWASGHQLHPQGSRTVAERKGWEKGRPRTRSTSTLTMATPLSLQQAAPTPRGASRGQVTLRPLQTPPSLAPPSKPAGGSSIGLLLGTQVSRVYWLLPLIRGLTDLGAIQSLPSV